MHEFTLAEEVLKISLAAARENGLARLAEVRVDVGVASGVNVGALLTAWEYMRATDALAQHAELAVSEIAAWGTCRACDYRGPLAEVFRFCPSCGTPGFRLERGGEFIVTGITGE